MCRNWRWTRYLALWSHLAYDSLCPCNHGPGQHSGSLSGEHAAIRLVNGWHYVICIVLYTQNCHIILHVRTHKVVTSQSMYTQSCDIILQVHTKLWHHIIITLYVHAKLFKKKTEACILEKGVSVLLFFFKES